MSTSATVRPMVVDDLAAVAAVTDSAFAALFERQSGKPVPLPLFPPLLFSTRFATDPSGCFVAAEDGGSGPIVGALFSVARGSLGWFGPLAVAPAAQGRGVGQDLAGACLEAWRARDVRLMGLETFGDSAFHVHLYSKLGFRAAWTGIRFQRAILPTPTSTPAPAGVESGGAPPSLDFLYEGLDLSAEAAVTAAFATGVTLASEGGFAILHTQPTFADPDTGFLPFVAAPTRASFDRLLDAAERVCAEQGLKALAVRVPGSNFGAVDALMSRGYRAGGVMVRMKQGERLEYDRGTLYCDNWL